MNVEPDDEREIVECLNCSEQVSVWELCRVCTGCGRCCLHELPWVAAS